ncbi:MAG TPA: hypothetical protein PLQ87_11450 [Phycisphaerae bacterium]|jgi:anti-sigma factor RsiW|nr:hypothetical protein [Phycisphaerae bacterium]
MSAGSDRLEHLFSRYLDGECTPQERALLESLLRRESEVRAQFDEYRAVDRAVGGALRAAMEQPGSVVPRRGVGLRVAKGLTVAAAACLAAFVWLQPKQTAPTRGAGRPTMEAGAGSWFAPLVPQVDSIEQVPTAYVRPELRVRGTEREWIVIPGGEPNTYLVIEVDRVRTHVIGVHRDF